MVDISVILCCHNGEGTVARALDSAFAQSMPATAFEVVFVNDGSTDGTASVLEPYVERHVNLHYIHCPEKVGLPSACNIGLERATGSYVIRLDDDDTFEAGILEAMVGPLGKDLTDLVYSDRYEVLGSTGRVKIVSMRDFNLFRLTASGVMVRRDFLLELGGYRPLFWEEYDLYMRYAGLSGRPYYYIPRPLYRYVRRPESMTLRQSQDRAREGWEELKETWGELALRRFGWDPELVDASPETQP